MKYPFYNNRPDYLKITSHEKSAKLSFLEKDQFDVGNPVCRAAASSHR
jgi:hypothetical protein